MPNKQRKEREGEGEKERKKNIFLLVIKIHRT